MQPTPVLLPGKSHGRRSLVDYSPWGRKESDMTEGLHFHFSQIEYSSLFSGFINFFVFLAYFIDLNLEQNWIEVMPVDITALSLILQGKQSVFCH